MYINSFRHCFSVHSFCLYISQGPEAIISRNNIILCRYLSHFVQRLLPVTMSGDRHIVISIYKMYIYIYLESYPFTTGETSTGVVEVASKRTQYETMSNLHSMIKKQYKHKIEKYYIAIHKIHKRAFFNKNMICIKMCFFFKCYFFKVHHLHLALKLISVQIHSKYDNLLKKTNVYYYS